MPVRLLELGAESERKSENIGTSIVTGTVINNCDRIMQGKVLVRIPSLDQEVWARLTAIGAGSSGRGFFNVPQPDDEVLVALNQSDPVDAFIIGGLWNNLDRTPANVPTDGQTKRILRTGIKAKEGVPPIPGHNLVLDDALQSITITSSTQQKITIDPTKIELTNLAGSLTISLDNKTQTISIKALKGIELDAKGTISLNAAIVDINGKLQTNVKSNGFCVIQGKQVHLNPPGAV